MFMKQGLTLIVLFAMLLAGCGSKEEPVRVNLEKRESVASRTSNAGQRHIRIAVGGMITPREGLAYYRQFLDYIADKMGTKVDFVDREDYGEINELLKKGEIDAAFVCSGPYVDGHKDFGLELLVAPQAYGETVYYSYIIVSKDSPFKSFEELKGRSFAFTDPLSNSGKLVPTYMLAKMNQTPDSFFRKYIFTRGHDKSIKAVAQGVVDGAAVDSLIWEYASRTDPEFTSKTRIIKRSPPFAIPPVVVPRGLAPETKDKLRQIFLNAANDERGRQLLSKMMIDKFVEIEDGAYNSIREMKRWIGKAEGRQQEG